jgi:FkbM family methyltransferase
LEARGVPEDLDRASFLAMKDRVRAGAVVLDLGANVGMYTLLMARWAGPAGKVFAFEPAPGIAGVLGEHIRLNGLGDRVEAVQAAVGEAVGQVTFFAAGLSGHGSVAAAAVPGGTPAVVPVTTVDAFCEQRGLAPTFVKIDVEGYEAHVLDGARETIRRHRPVLLIETHPHVWPDLGLSRADVAGRLDALRGLGYRVDDLDGAGDPLGVEAHILCRWTV